MSDRRKAFEEWIAGPDGPFANASGAIFTRCEDNLFPERIKAGEYVLRDVRAAWLAAEWARSQALEEAATVSDGWIGCESISKEIRELKEHP